jgi:thiamine-phosphate pyrophosphorylase
MAAGARLFQLRAKSLKAGSFIALAQAAMTLAESVGATIIVNDRVDVARLAVASGAHLGQEDLPVRAARQQLGATAVVGLSTHTEEQVRQALGAPLSYVAVGPVFDTASKVTGYPAVGTGLVESACQLAGVPVVAIGGIAPENVRSVIAAGASAVAVIGGLVGPDAGERVRRYLDCLM